MKNRIEAFAASHEDFPAMLKKAQQYLVTRGKLDRTESLAAVPPLRYSDSLGEDEKCVWVCLIRQCSMISCTEYFYAIIERKPQITAFM